MSSAPQTPPKPQPKCKLPWFEIEDPDSPQLDELAKRFTLHPLQIEDCRHRPQRAKYEEHESYLFLVAKKIDDGEMLVFEDVDVFIGKDFLITVTRGHLPVVDRVHRRVIEDGTARVDRGLYFLIDSIVDEYSPVID